jgi:hypothetical protein
MINRLSSVKKFYEHLLEMLTVRERNDALIFLSFCSSSMYLHFISEWNYNWTVIEMFE